MAWDLNTLHLFSLYIIVTFFWKPYFLTIKKKENYRNTFFILCVLKEYSITFFYMYDPLAASIVNLTHVIRHSKIAMVGKTF